MSPKARERALTLSEDKERYIPDIMNWKVAITNSDKNQTYNTPSIATIFFLRQQLNLMNDISLEGAIDYAKKHLVISNEQLGIIMHARKTLLFHESTTWVKKSGEEDFDVPMGCYDGAEVCEIVGTFILNKLKNIIDIKDLGLYRDDGLGILRNLSGPDIDRKRKKIISIFKSCGLSITVEVNKKVVNYLDVQLNLNDHTFRPYRKPNNNPVYVNKESNHPPNIINELPDSINRRLSDISSNETIFKNSAPLYEDALKSSGYNIKLNFVQNDTTPNNVNNNEEDTRRKRKIIWYNPPFSRNVKTNVGKIFFKLVNKHFHKKNPLHKIFNKNTLKLSYSCMRNISDIISSHNKATLRISPDKFGCNCRSKANCPVDNKCLTPKVIYKAEVTTNINDEKKFYIGLSETPFKDRFRNHTKSIKNKRYENETLLSKYVWELKEKSIEYNINWSILKTIKSKLNSKKCSLCLMEKYFIISSLGNNDLLNKKNEFVSKCRHMNKVLLNSVVNDTMD
jgi:hypothetical protein